ncbi:hypothetical protein KVT40_002534 [Elsinoe batatas]|uniref:Secreted protein n=1 Tax=Elsinoe batatas TaxID=2601811 RepID=A0A8K0L2U7_9PEZI|nr:hypothetical protein KVT40_002534 [Elsinoe batatas]
MVGSLILGFLVFAALAHSSSHPLPEHHHRQSRLSNFTSYLFATLTARLLLCPLPLRLDNARNHSNSVLRSLRLFTAVAMRR